MVRPVRRRSSALLAVAAVTAAVATLGLANASAASAADTCAPKSRPAGKVLQGYWESWDNSSVHPGMGHIAIDDSRQTQHGYNVLMAAFPVILPDGTVKWEDGMDTGVDVPTPAQVCAAKAQGQTVLLSIGGANAAIDLSSSKVADRFVATIVPILKANNFDGVDIDIESGLTGSGSIGTLSTSQANLVRVIDGILAQMPAGFGLTMAPETAYVTGGSITYGSIWGSYLPVIKRYLDNGRLWWLNMQYYNGSMYDCTGNSYNAGTVAGFVAQTRCLDAGLTVQGTTVRVPYDKQVPGLPAQVGAGGGYMDPSLVSQAWSQLGGAPKGLMTWSINWDGSKGWTFGDNARSLFGGGSNPGGGAVQLAEWNGKCVDINGASTADGATAIQWPCGTGTNQRFTVQDAGGGYVRLVAQHSGKCLDVTGSSTADGAAIIQWTCGSGNNQQWTLASNGSVVSRSSGKCLDVPGFSTTDAVALDQWSCNGGANQTFTRR